MKIFRGVLSVEFDCDKVTDKMETAAAVEKLLKAGAVGFEEAKLPVTVKVETDFANVRPAKAKVAQPDSTPPTTHPADSQTDLEAAIAAKAA